MISALLKCDDIESPPVSSVRDLSHSLHKSLLRELLAPSSVHCAAGKCFSAFCKYTNAGVD